VRLYAKKPEQLTAVNQKDGRNFVKCWRSAGEVWYLRLPRSSRGVLYLDCIKIQSTFHILTTCVRLCHL